MNELEKIRELVDKYNLKKMTRERDIVYKRFFICHFMRMNRVVKTLREIAEIVGYKKHDNVLNAINTHNDLKTDNVYQFITEEIRADLYEIIPPKHANNKEKSLKELVLDCHSYRDLLRLKEILKSTNQK